MKIIFVVIEVVLAFPVLANTLKDLTSSVALLANVVYLLVISLVDIAVNLLLGSFNVLCFLQHIFVVLRQDSQVFGKVEIVCSCARGVSWDPFLDECPRLPVSSKQK